MLRKLATYMLWLGLFGLFLFFAAHSVGVLNTDLLLAALGLLGAGWLILRKPPRQPEPSKRFRALRRLGMIGSEQEEEEN